MQKENLLKALCAGAVALAMPLGLMAQAASTAAKDNTDDVVQLEAFNVTEMKSFSDQAIAGKTPIAFTEYGKEKILDELGSRDIPLILNSSPSVFATNDGGGAGDARINVRGFDQRNMSILINGVPTNDMENGWLYWSNWDGLGDVSAAIQMQRGLSKATLPTPSIGGTMNIITDPASQKRGYSVKVEAGYDEFYKLTGVMSTGLLNDKFAVTLGGVMKTGLETNSVRGTWTEGTAYYAGMLYIVNPKNRLEFFAIGAPQRHGQRTFASNIAAYDSNYARSLGYTDAQITAALVVGPVNAGRDFNPNQAPVTRGYAGQQFWDGEVHSRYDSTFLNERENYFHKPQINLNWYSTISDELKLTTVFYFSGGVGGGSGTLNNGSSSAAFARYANASGPYGSNIDWDGTVTSNAGSVSASGSAKTAGQSLGILRNSVNVQSQVGVVSKLTYTVSPGFTLTTGVDWRDYQADHFQEVRDLLGGTYYIATTSQDSDFWINGPATKRFLGDKVGYYYHSNVDWLGGFVQAEYEKGPITAFATYGLSNTVYGYTDQFHKNTAGTGPIKFESDGLIGQQAKGGVNYALSEQLSVFGNAGWVTKPPVFTTVVDTFNSKLLNANDETFKSVEAGVRWQTKDRRFNVTANYYYTQWRNRSSTTTSATTTTYRRGINANYSGFEFEAAYQPNKWVRFDAAGSVAKWYYTSDGTVEVRNDSDGTLASTGALYIADLKVGDAPQTQYAASVTVYPVKGLSVQLQSRWYQRYYSDFDPVSRTSSADRGQVWQIPSYNLLDLHVNYTLPLKSDSFESKVFLHVFNLTDELYISDSTDNSSFEGINSAPSHSAQRAEVFLGAPLTVNAGIRFTF